MKEQISRLQKEIEGRSICIDGDIGELLELVIQLYRKPENGTDERENV